MLKQTCSNCQILTEKPLITLLHTTMFFILFIYYDCTRNLWFALKTWDNVKVLFSFSGSWQVMTTVFLFLLSLKGPSIRPFMRGIHGMSCALDSTPWIPSSRYSVLDPRLQSLVGFRIPKPRISDSTSTNFHDSGLPKKKIYRIHVHGAIWRSWKFWNVCVRNKDRVNRSQRSKGSYKLLLLSLWWILHW